MRYYGQWMRDKAFKQIGHLYPNVNLSQEYGGGEATVIAWLWARTVKCPNPGCGAQMPLVRSFALSTKKDKQAWVEPIVEQSQQPSIVRFQVKTGKGQPPDGTVSRRGAICICCSTPVPFDHIRSEGKAGRMDAQLMAIVVVGQRGRLYLSPTQEHEEIATSAKPEWKPETDLPEQALGFRVQNYGMTKHADLFTSRQLVALTTFSDLVREAREKVLIDAMAARIPDDGLPLCDNGVGATAYADAVATYLAFSVDKCADYWSNICTWAPHGEYMGHVFTRQAIPMVWDFAEANPFSNSTANFQGAIGWIDRVVQSITSNTQATAQQLDATIEINGKNFKLISTDPPYYDAVSYSNLSDFFYVWVRSALKNIYPNLCSTLLVPKEGELVADPFRHGSREKAKQFFEEGLSKVFANARKSAHPDYPLTVYYAFKQTETDEDNSSNQVNVASTGWETMLEGLIQAGFTITGTLPIRTELSNRMRGHASNALASSIVLVCRPRPESAPSTTRRQFVNTLKRELPDALHKLQQGNIAPVDLAQASIGPGMAIYSRYTKVLESDGTPMRVRTALQLINQTLDEFFAEQEGEFDAETRWALTWFEQYAFNEGLFGNAETLSKAKNTAVQGMVNAGILFAKAGKVRLLRRDELPKDWNPKSDNRLTDWEATQQMIRELQDGGGDRGAANLLSQLGTIGEAARELAYRLYSICDRKGWAAEGVAYNSLVISWSDISRLADEKREAVPLQQELF